MPMITRRTFIASTAILPLTISSSAIGKAYFPNSIAKQIRHGDLIWIRSSDEWIPYNAGTAQKEFEERLNEVTKNRDLLSSFPTLDRLTYNEFHAAYFEGHLINQLENYRDGNDSVGVGHVGIIQIINSEIFVIEAANQDLGVIRTPLRNWILGLGPTTKFWIGRFRTAPPGEFIPLNKIDAIVQVAAEQAKQKKSYDFFNFDLADSTGFYCSKLVWYATFQATGRKLDKGVKYWLPWYSPKQLLSSPFLDIVINPESY